jgi:hypothetical protein
MTTIEGGLITTTTITYSQDYQQEVEKTIAEGLDFILNHFKEPI